MKIQCWLGAVLFSLVIGGSSATPFTEDGSGSGGGPITPDPECYSEGRVNLGPLDYDFSGLSRSVVGPIEICVNGQYLSLCDIGWDEANAQALCHQRLGYNVVAEPLYGLGFPRIRYAPRTFNCSEYDYGLYGCSYTSVIDPECSSGAHVAGVRCRESCTDGEIELRNSTSTYDNGLSTYRGRVDVCINTTFMPICDVGWDERDAQVACRQAYGSNYIGEVYPSFPLFPSSNYIAQEVMCNGTEYSFRQCNYNPPTSPECFVGSRSAAVVCRQVCTEGDVRLVNQSRYLSSSGLSAISGVVQVCVNQQYGYVCADNWDDNEAEVVCRSQSFRYRAPYYENTASATSLIFRDAPIYRYSMCNGTEYNFNRCQLPRSDSNSTCASVGIVNCTEVISQCYSDGRFRLANSTTNSSSDGSGTVVGRIEVCANSSYRSLCYQYWDQVDAQVFCEYYLGTIYFLGRDPDSSINITGRLALPSQYGYSNAGVVAYNVRCNGSESRLEDCDIDKSPDSALLCQDPSSSAAGVVCTSTVIPTPCTDFDLRARNETYQTAQGFYQIYEANIEVCINGTYVAICDLGWDDTEAQLACNALGFNERIYRGVALSRFTATSSIGIENVECPSNVIHASQCSGVIPPQSPRCLSNFSAAGIRCIQERSECYREGDISIVNVTYDNYLAVLVGGDLSVTGRVGVCQDGLYGSVCDINWDQKDANVICNDIGLSLQYDVTPLYGYNVGADPIILETIDCTGNESDASSCPTSRIGRITNSVCCESNRAAGVRCSLKPGSCINGSVRLADGPAFYEGRLEVCRNNQWLAVCEEGFNMSTALTVCNQRLYLAGNSTEVFYGSAYGSGTGPMLITCHDIYYLAPNFVPIGNCSSNRASNLTCTHGKDVGVRCSKGQLDISAIPKGSRRLGSSSFSIQCFAQQFPWNTTLISGDWYDMDGNPVIETSKGGPVSVDLLQNVYDTGGFMVNLTYTFRNQLNFDHPLSVSDGGYYSCNISVELTYPDNSKAILSNSTVYPLIVEVPLPSVMITSKDTPFHNRPYTATCMVTFEAAVPLDMVEIEWMTADGSDLTDISDRVKLSPIRQTSDSSFARDVIVNPLKFEDSGVYTCEAGAEGKFIISRSVYEVAQITVLTPPPSPPEVQGLCSNVVWYSPEVSCEGISGYDVRLYNPQSVHQNLTRRIGANGTFYVIRDEDKLAGSDETYVQVRVIHSSGVGEWSIGTSLGCDPKPTPVPEIPNVYFEINGKVYLNNSAIPLIETGEDTSALYCKTNKEECCGTVPNRFGQFYYPNGTQVPVFKQQQGFYRNRGEQVIRLNRREGNTSPIGTYRCEIPNADDMMVKIYITLTE